jgi:hypothetical protein
LATIQVLQPWLIDSPDCLTFIYGENIVENDKNLNMAEVANKTLLFSIEKNTLKHCYRSKTGFVLKSRRVFFFYFQPLVFA